MSDTPKDPGKLPQFARDFRKQYPEVWEAYSQLGEAAGKAGPMDERALRLVKLGLAVGARSQGSVHSHTRRGLAEGIPAEELEQVALLAITSLGYSNAMAALAWITDVTRPDKEESETKG
jgi:alkylhydroperoxidase/carboxymuconolactone decarboxylase family protein YurZ